MIVDFLDEIESLPSRVKHDVFFIVEDDKENVVIKSDSMPICIH